MNKIVAIIPARYGSTRFPGKALVPIEGRPMIQWVYERAKRARMVDRVVVATDDERIQSGRVRVRRGSGHDLAVPRYRH